MTDTSNPLISSDTDQKIKALTEKKEALSHELVKKAEKLHNKAGELVDTAKDKEAVDDNLAKTNADLLSLKTEELEKTDKLMVGRELKMIEQKKELAQLKKSS